MTASIFEEVAKKMMSTIVMPKAHAHQLDEQRRSPRYYHLHHHVDDDDDAGLEDLRMLNYRRFPLF